MEIVGMGKRSKIEDSIRWIRTKRFFRYWTKRLARERYGVDIAVAYISLKPLSQYNHISGNMYVEKRVRGAEATLKTGKTMILYDNETISKFVPYPRAIAALMQHELAHIRVDGHGDDYWEELSKYTDDIDVDIVLQEVVPNYSYFWFKCAARRYDPWQYGIIQGFVIYMISLVTIAIRGKTE